MITCGNLGDGKPCEFYVNHGCPGGNGHGDEQYPDEDACAPVLALLEARREAAKWKRAAEILAEKLEHGYAVDHYGKAWLDWAWELALKEVP